jgi:hypothetical protein
LTKCQGGKIFAAQKERKKVENGKTRNEGFFSSLVLLSNYPRWRWLKANINHSVRVEAILPVSFYKFSFWESGRGRGG